MRKTIKVAFISDTHGQHRSLNIPEADVLIHGGDFTKMDRMDEYIDFNDWWKSLPHKYKLLIPGNHDSMIQRHPKQARLHMEDVIIVQDLCAVLPNGLRVFGTPWVPTFGDWAFMLPANSEAMWEKREKIFDCDILVCHGPAYGILDKTTRGDNAGCKLLLQKIREIKPQVFLCGHIHEGNGEEFVDDTRCINGAVLDERYQLVNEPKVFEIEIGEDDEE